MQFKTLNDPCSTCSFPVGLDDVSKLPAIFTALIEDTEFNWTDDDLAKLASGNVLRVLREVEAVRDSRRDQKAPMQWIDKDEIKGLHDGKCMNFDP